MRSLLLLPFLLLVSTAGAELFVTPAEVCVGQAVELAASAPGVQRIALNVVQGGKTLLSRSAEGAESLRAQFRAESAGSYAVTTDNSTPPGSFSARICGDDESPGAVREPPLPSKGFQVLRGPLLIEILAGETLVVGFTLGSSGRQLDVKIGGLPAEWAEPETHNLTVDGEATLNLFVAVPAGARSGDYRATLNGEPLFVLRVLPESKLVSVSRMVGRDGSGLLISLRLRNGDAPTKRVELVEELETDATQLRFSVRPEVSGERPLLLRWRFEELLPRESRTVSYGLPEGGFQYLRQSYRQLATFSRGESAAAVAEARFGEVRVPPLLRGRAANATVTLNSSDAIEATLTAEPELWGAAPANISLKPGSNTVALSLLPAASGTQTLRLRLRYGSSETTKVETVAVAEDVTLPLGALAAALAVVAAILLQKRRGRRRRGETVTALRDIKHRIR